MLQVFTSKKKLYFYHLAIPSNQGNAFRTRVERGRGTRSSPSRTRSICIGKMYGCHPLERTNMAAQIKFTLHSGQKHHFYNN
jgi:hypothetical protein